MTAHQPGNSARVWSLVLVAIVVIQSIYIALACTRPNAVLLTQLALVILLAGPVTLVAYILQTRKGDIRRSEERS